MPRPDGGSGLSGQQSEDTTPQAPQGPTAPLFVQPVVETEVKTLGAVPGLYELLKAQGQYSFTPRPIDRPLDAVSGAEVGLGVDEIGQLGAEQDSNSPLDELTLDGAAPVADPMQDLHMPDLKKLGITQTSKTTTTTTKNPPTITISLLTDASTNETTNRTTTTAPIPSRARTQQNNHSLNQTTP